MVVVQEATKALATGNTALGPVVIRRARLGDPRVRMPELIREANEDDDARRSDAAAAMGAVRQRSHQALTATRAPEFEGRGHGRCYRLLCRKLHDSSGTRV